MSTGSNVYSEVYAFLNLLGEEYIKKIPREMYELFSSKRNMNYELRIDTSKKISEQFKNEETLIIISALNLYFFCNGEERKKLVKIYEENDEKFLNRTFSEKINKTDIDIVCSNKLEPKKKENIFTKIINKLKRIFKR